MAYRILFILLGVALLASCGDSPYVKPQVYHANYLDSSLTQMQFEPSGFQFDTLKNGDTLIGKFKIHNVGKKNLHIDSIIKACSCTKISEQSRIISPGQSIDVFFSIHPPGKETYYVTPIIFYFNTKPFYRQFLVEGYVK